MTRIFRIALKLSPFLLAAHLGAQQLRYDANWWKKSSEQERWGFVLGYVDCRQTKNAHHGSEKDYETFVSRYLIHYPQSVTRAIDASQRDMPDRPIDPHAEQWPERHGWLDGGWWGSSNIGDAGEKKGFIEGYAECSSPNLSKRKLSSVSVAIDHFYDLPSHDTIFRPMRRLR